jgi:hypothetical protein
LHYLWIDNTSVNLLIGNSTHRNKSTLKRILSMGGHFPTQSKWYFALENDLPLIVFPHKSVFCV